MIQSYAIGWWLAVGVLCGAVWGQEREVRRVGIHVNAKVLRVVGERAFVLGSLPGESGPGTGGMEIVDVKTGRTIKSLKVPTSAAHFDVQGDRLFLALGKGGVVILDWRTGKAIGEIKSAGIVWNIFVYEQYACLYAATKLAILNWKTGKVVAKHDLKGAGRGLQLVGRTLYYAHQYPGGIQTIDVPTGKIIHEISCFEWLASLRIVGNRAYCQSSFKLDYLVFDLKSGKEVGRIDLPHRSTFSERFAFSTLKKTVEIRDLRTRAVVRTLDVPGVRLTHAERDSLFIATSSELLIFRADEALGR